MAGIPKGKSMTEQQHDTVRAVEWTDEGMVKLLDQRVLPLRQEYVLLEDVGGVAAAIRDMVVRGAPAIGVTAAYGVALAARRRYAANPAAWRENIEEDLALLAASRPTAVNLFWALDRMRGVIATLHGDPRAALLDEAKRIHAEDVAANRRMGLLGAGLIQGATQVLTHCNTGSLATGGYGTALGVIRAGYTAGRITHVYADETRPWLQGARLTAWELVEDGIPSTLIVEGAAASLMRAGGIGWVILGADRIAANGDTANKIGTYSLAVLARHHGIKFMVVAPTTTIDMSIPDGKHIHIENRPPAEILSWGGNPVAAAGIDAWNPSFDTTPADLIDVIVTERGVVHQPTLEKMAALMAGHG